jgi:cytidine deaminase
LSFKLKLEEALFNSNLIGYTEEDLIKMAREAAAYTYSPYSNFPVGAAVVFEKGVSCLGCNIENPSFGLTICAERTAIFSARAQGHLGKILAIGVSCLKSDPNEPDSLMPCGACRQVIQEFSTSETAIVVDGVGTFLVADLLPRAFKLPS